MTIRYEDQTFMCNNAEEMPCPHDTAPLDTSPATHSILDLDSETAAGYSEDTNHQKYLAQLQGHSHQLQERLNQLGPTTNPPVYIEEQAHLNEKLQQLARHCSCTHPVGLWMNPYIQQCSSTLKTFLCHTATDELPHILTPRHPHI